MDHSPLSPSLSSSLRLVSWCFRCSGPVVSCRCLFASPPPCVAVVPLLIDRHTQRCRPTHDSCFSQKRLSTSFLRLTFPCLLEYSLLNALRLVTFCFALLTAALSWRLLTDDEALPISPPALQRHDGHDHICS
ncbi:hypothetical protein JDV02_004526 [Purpureocillium takamizusanense]|uniref:Uncharacterized protein n=1 Tax=Purpureocillium takamizusanense TaxID=2060973 RepID=A0A9Q8VAW2_9HYPO|nr:uncharacterized protein JDV02_004526 [Purpureocillium takamizusanense]UNI18246.1 hypothetical protein JDV02_004526 [Purpureocillium takamizusanense]